jgi:hypothetical protein
MPPYQSIFSMGRDYGAYGTPQYWQDVERQAQDIRFGGAARDMLGRRDAMYIDPITGSGRARSSMPYLSGSGLGTDYRYSMPYEGQLSAAGSAALNPSRMASGRTFNNPTSGSMGGMPRGAQSYMDGIAGLFGGGGGGGYFANMGGGGDYEIAGIPSGGTAVLRNKAPMGYAMGMPITGYDQTGNPIVKFTPETNPNYYTQMYDAYRKNRGGVSANYFDQKFYDGLFKERTGMSRDDYNLMNANQEAARQMQNYQMGYRGPGASGAGLPPGFNQRMYGSSGANYSGASGGQTGGVLPAPGSRTGGGLMGPGSGYGRPQRNPMFAGMSMQDMFGGRSPSRRYGGF